MFSEAKFHLDSIPEMEFNGFHDGRDWNGWAVPYFEFAEAQRVLKASESNGYTWRYDEPSDSFEVEDELGQIRYPCELIECDGMKHKVYGIGAAEWIWDVVQLTET